MIAQADSILTRLPSDLVTRLSEMPGMEFWRLIREPMRHESQREIYRDACAMTRSGFSAAEQREVIKARFQRYYRPISDREIENAIANADGDPTPRVPRWPRINSEARQEVIASRPAAFAELRSASPESDPQLIPTGAILDRLFNDEDLICLGTANHCAYTEERKFFREREAEFPYIVPSPMANRIGITKSGNPSCRSLSNVGRRVHVVVEFDHGTLDEQAAIHLHLRNHGVPLRMVVFSGSKSLHGWFDVRGLSESECEKFLRYAAYLGADVHTFSPIQFVRTPNVWRDETRHQSVHFLV